MELVARYRALAVILVTALIIVFVPVGRRVVTVAGGPAGSVGDASGAPVGGSVGASPGAIGGAGSEGGPGAGATPGGPAPGTAPAAGARGSAGAATVQGNSVSVGGVTYPGIGTEAALANPNCDRERGRIRFPSFAAAPCVAPWPDGADNGGATAPGVDATTIRIVYTQNRTSTTTDDDLATERQIATEMFETYAQHHELWGRTIDLKFYERSGTDEVAQRADAIQVANDLKPFLTIDPTIAARPMVVFSAEMAARGIVAFDHQPPWKDTQALAPYRFGIGHDERLFAEHIAEFAAKSLAGRPARWAGTPTLQLETRAFGLIYPDTWDIGFFDEAARSFGLPITDKIAYATDDITSYQDQSRVQMARFDNAGVNNILAAAELLYLPFATREATARNYFPEWTVTGWGVSDTSLGGRLYDPAQTAHMFGIGPVPVLLDNPSQNTNRVYNWHTGHAPADAATAGTQYLLLESIFIGLQGAGPHLTAETFRNALFTAPPSGGYWCGCVTSTGISFGRAIQKPWDDYSAWDDMTLKWWKSDETSPDEIGLTAPGTWVMVDQGKRYVPGTYPTSEPPFFVNENIAHHMNASTMPAPDKWPPYEHDAALHTSP